MIVLTGPGGVRGGRWRAHREAAVADAVEVHAARTHVGQERSACRHKRRPAAAQRRAAVSCGAPTAIGVRAWPRQDRLRSVFLASPSYELSSS